MFVYYNVLSFIICLMSFEQKLFLTDLYAHLEVICPFPTLSASHFDACEFCHIISVIWWNDCIENENHILAVHMKFKNIKCLPGTTIRVESRCLTSCLTAESAIGQNANLKDRQFEPLPAHQAQWHAQPSPGANSKKHTHTHSIILWFCLWNVFWP